MYELYYTFTTKTSNIGAEVLLAGGECVCFE